MGGFASIVRGALAGLNESAGNNQTAEALQQRNQQAQEAKRSQIRAQLVPHAIAVKGLQERLQALDPQDPHYADQKAILTNDIARNLHEVRSILYPDQDPKGNFFERGITDKLHLTSMKHRQDKFKAVQEKGKKEDTASAQAIAEGQVPYSQSPKGVAEAQKEKAALTLQEAKNKGAQDRGSASRPVPYYRGAVNKKHAMEAHEAGKTYMDQEGNEIDPANIPDGMFLLPIFAGGGKEYYELTTDPGRYESAGNQRLLEPAIGGPNPEAPSLGPVRVPTTSVSTATSPGGQQVVTGTRTSTPANSSLPATTPVGATPSPPGPVLHTRGSQALGAARGVQKAQSEGILPNIQNMTPQNARLAQKAQPAVTALLGIYGDPRNPSAPSMVEYAKLADDPHSQKVLGEAFKLLDQSMGEISDPGIIQTLGTAAGWANFRAQAEAGAQQAAGTQMRDDERAYFDAAISSMADIIGSRSATGQSAARFSVRSIQNELPLIGLSGTPDRTSYLTKLQTVGRQIRVGLNGMPDNSRALAWLDKREADIEKEKKSGNQKAIVQHSPSTGKYRYSLDGGQTWQPGQPPKQ